MINIKKQFEELSTQMKATLAFMMCSFFQRGISILTTPIFTRLLTANEYGFYSIFNSWLEIISVFTTLKLAGSVFMQALVKYEDNKDQLTASTAGIGTTVTLLFLLLYIPLRKWINIILGMNTLVMLCIFITSWATLMFELWADQQRIQYKYRALIILTIITSIAKPIFGIFAILSTNQHKAEARILSLALIELITYSWIFISFLKKGHTFFNKKFWKYSLSLNLPLIPHYLTRVVLNQSDRLMINAMVGSSSAGIYSLAHNLAWMLTLITNSILNTLNPWIFQQIKKKDFGCISELSYVVLRIVAIIGLGLISIAPEVVKVFAPTDYYNAIWVIPPLCASVFFLFMYSLFANFEYYYEKTKFLMIASTMGGILNIILNYFCIKEFGYIAAGYTTLLCYIFYAVTHYCCMKRILEDNLNGIKIYDIKVILKISIAFVSTCVIFMLTYNIILLRYSIIIISLIIIYIRRYNIINILRETKKKN